MARHTRVLAGEPTILPRHTAAPPGFRPEDFMDVPELDAYVTIPEAAERMDVTEEQIMNMAMRFLLSYRVIGRTVTSGPPSSARGSPVLRPCAECGHRTESVTLGPGTGTLALCHLCA